MKTAATRGELDSQQRSPLTERLAIGTRAERRAGSELTPRAGCRRMKLDGTAAEGKVRFPWVPGRKKKAKKLAEQKQTYEHLVRVGRVSMVQIGEDDFRTPSRRERHNDGIRHGRRTALAFLAGQSRPSLGKRRVQVDMSEEAVAQRRYIAAAEREVGTTRKAKLQRKAIEEKNKLVEASYAAARAEA